MGASALMSALNALPWDDDSEGSSSDSDDESRRHSQVPPPSAPAPQAQRVGRPKGMTSRSDQPLVKEAKVDS
jgi:sterol 3beta-glucosyltransferase